MDPTRPSKQTEQTSSHDQTTTLTSIVNSHSSLFVDLQKELASTFSSIRREINDLRSSSVGANAALSEQLVSLNETLVENFSKFNLGQSNVSQVDSFENFVQPAPVPVQPGCEPRLPCPSTFEGDLSLCRGFISQCELLFRHQTSRYASAESRVALVISLLSGRALKWAVATLEKDPQLSYDYQKFITEFRLVFDHPTAGQDSSSRLLSLTQGSRSVADYAVEFRILAAESKWDNEVLLYAFRKGLSDQIKDLILRDRPTTLADLISLALRVDEHLLERRQERSLRGQERSHRAQARYPPNQSFTRSRQIFRNQNPEPKSLPIPVRESVDEPMQIGRSRVSPEERELRLKGGLCFYCGKAGHMVRECAARPKDNAP